MDRNGTTTVNGGGAFGRNPGIALDPSISDAWSKHLRKRTESRAAIVRLVLPSTLPVDAMRMPVQYLWRNGMIPDPLTAVMQEHIAVLEKPDTAGETMIEQWEADPETAWKNWRDVLVTVWLACVVQPSFTDDEAQVGESGPYHVNDVDYMDLLYVYQWAQGVDQSVVDFLHEQTEIMDRLSDGPDLQGEAKRILRANRTRGRVARPAGGSGDVPVGSDGGAVATGASASPEAVANAEADDDGPAEVRAGRNHADDPRPTTDTKSKRKRTGGRVAVVPPTP